MPPEEQTFESEPQQVPAAEDAGQHDAIAAHEWKRYAWAGAVLITVLLAAAALPFLWGVAPGEEQDGQDDVYKVGVLRYIPALSEVEEGFYAGMRELGYVEGENTEYIVTPYGESPEKMQEIAQDLIDQDVDLIFAITNVAATGALEATRASGADISIIFSHANTPERTGLVQSFESSGNNLTGVAVDFVDITEKKLEFLKQIDPTISRVGVLDAVHTDPAGIFVLNELRTAAPRFGIEIVAYPVKNPHGPDATEEIAAIAQVVQPGDIDAFFYLPGPISNPPSSVRIVLDMAERLKIPSALLLGPQVTELGGLFLYAHDLFAMGQQSAVFAKKILDGQHPSEIPIEFPKRNTLTINMSTARELGLTIPEPLLLIADHIVE